MFSEISNLRIIGNGNSGPIVVQHNDIVKPVCFNGYLRDHDWGDTEALVACRQAGYEFGWAMKFANIWDVRLTIGDVECSGGKQTVSGVMSWNLHPSHPFKFFQCMVVT